MASVHIVGEISGAVSPQPPPLERRARRARRRPFCRRALGAVLTAGVWRWRWCSGRRAEQRSGAQLLANEQVAVCSSARARVLSQSHAATQHG